MHVWVGISAGLALPQPGAVDTQQGPSIARAAQRLRRYESLWIS